MYDRNWSTLVKKQDQFVQREDQIEQQRKSRIKQLYKNQLQKMIQYNKNHVQDQKQYDRQLLNYAKQLQRKRIIKQKQQIQHKLRTNEKIARQNLLNNQNKKNKMFENYLQEKKIYGERFKRAMTEVKQQTKSRIQHREQQKIQLAKAYDIQLEYVQARKKLQKMQDEKFSKLLQQIQKKKQQNRKSYFDKLRKGYRQNPQVYQNSATLLLKNQQQRIQFIRKFTNQNPYSNYLTQKQTIQKQRVRKIKQASQFNKNYYQTKAQKQRYQSLQQINDYSGRYKAIQVQLQSQKQHQLREVDIKRRRFKHQLDMQVQQSNMKRNLNNKMDDNEYFLNKSTNIAALPGLTKDYAAKKQQQILQSFLKGNSRKNVQFSA